MSALPMELAMWVQEEILSFLEETIAKNKEVKAFGATFIMVYKESVYALNVGNLPKAIFQQAIKDVANGDYEDAEGIESGTH